MQSCWLEEESTQSCRHGSRRASMGCTASNAQDGEAAEALDAEQQAIGSNAAGDAWVLYRALGCLTLQTYHMADGCCLI
jgi:hypothetical protein